MPCSWITKTYSALLLWHFYSKLWTLCSKCLHKWSHVHRLVKPLLMQFLSHTEVPFSLFIHVFTNRNGLFLIVWLEISLNMRTILKTDSNHNLNISDEALFRLQANQMRVSWLVFFSLHLVGHEHMLKIWPCGFSFRPHSATLGFYAVVLIHKIRVSDHLHI